MTLSRIILSAILLAAVAGLAGCGEDETTAPSGYDENAFIVGYVSRLNVDRSGASTGAAAAGELYEAGVGVTNVSSIPLVTVNGIELPQNSFRGPVSANLLRVAALIPSSGGLSFYGRIMFQGDDASLAVRYKKGDGSSASAAASIRVPGSFHLLEISNGGNITPSVDVTARWTPSADADRFYLSGMCAGTYRDTAGQFVYYSFMYDTLATDTFFVFRARDIFPDWGDVDYIEGFNASVNLAAVNGPFMPGERDNISGDGRGFFIGTSMGAGIYLYYSAPATAGDAAAPPIERPDPESAATIHERLMTLAAEQALR